MLFEGSSRITCNQFKPVSSATAYMFKFNDILHIYPTLGVLCCST